MPAESVTDVIFEPSGGIRSAEGAGGPGCSAGNAVIDCWVGTTATGRWAGAAVATAEGTPVWLGVAPADAVVSLLNGVELVCAPPELCTTPERASAVEASLGKEVELVWASTESCTIPDVEPDEKSAAEADEFIDGVGPVLAADSDDELAVDDDESDDEIVEPESVGSANATPGVLSMRTGQCCHDRVQRVRQSRFHPGVA